MGTYDVSDINYWNRGKIVKTLKTYQRKDLIDTLQLIKLIDDEQNLIFLKNNF